MQNITCHSNGHHVSYNFKNAVSIKVAIVMTFFGRVWWWSSIFLCIYALGYVTGTLNAYSCCLGYLIWRYCLSLLLLVSFHVMLPLSYHFILFLLSVTESWPLSLCSISTSFIWPLEKGFAAQLAKLMWAAKRK